MSDKLQDAINAFGQSLNPTPKLAPTPAPSSSLLLGGPKIDIDKILSELEGMITPSWQKLGNKALYAALRAARKQCLCDDAEQEDLDAGLQFPDETDAFLLAAAYNAAPTLMAEIKRLRAAPALLSSGGPAAKVVRWVAPEQEMPKPWQKVECAVEEGDGSGWEHPQVGRTYHRLTCCEWNPGSETQQAGWYAKIGKVMERLPDTCLVRLWLSVPQEDVPTFALREKLLAAPVSTSLGGTNQLDSLSAYADLAAEHDDALPLTARAVNDGLIQLHMQNGWPVEATQEFAQFVADACNLAGAGFLADLRAENAKEGVSTSLGGGDAAKEVANMFPRAPALADEALAEMLENHRKAVDEWYGKGANERSREATQAEIERGALLAEVARLRHEAADQLLVDSSGAGNWISVDERLPEPGVGVLLTVREMSAIPGPDYKERRWVTRGQRDVPHEGKWLWRDGANGRPSYEPFQITHWQPLPAPAPTHD